MKVVDIKVPHSVLSYQEKEEKKLSKHKLFPDSHPSKKEKFLQLVESNIWRTICPRICILENYTANISWILHLLRESISSISKMLTKWDREFSVKWHGLLQKSITWSYRTTNTSPAYNLITTCPSRSHFASLLLILLTHLFANTLEVEE